ncbi:hypothetical protein VIGAN_04413800 [Vigna angularis var. angularis]|uniref:Amino acid transporter transmembrane domain-containing protein n=1 Tax=Vigna angularis var. angularis TaxID=157739 RepID=A0A0S3S0X8_PHAAN|nr:hypothetical protein VIGAN_04413800 [Vigna angularis var. angularis]
MSPTVGVSVPLLGESNGAVQPASVPGAVFNVATSIVGAGIMSIPAIIKVLGVVPAIAMIIVVAVLAELSVEFLMRFTPLRRNDDVRRRHEGSVRVAGALVAQACVIITNVGGLILYLIIIGDVLSGKQDGGEVHLGILQQWFGIHWWNSREFALLFTLVFVMFPLVLYKRVESLKYSSAVSTLLAVAFVGICCGASNWFEFAKPSQMTTAVRLALLLCTVIYITVGLFGYLLFGDSTQSDILINFDQTNDSGGWFLVQYFDPCKLCAPHHAGVSSLELLIEIQHR